MQLFVENLTNIDFSYLHPQRGLLGETWLVSIRVGGELDEQGMVCDFGIVKATLRQWLESELDHVLMVPRNADCLDLREVDSDIELHWRFDSGVIQCRSPAQAITVVDRETIDEAALASWGREQLAGRLPSGVELVELSFTPENITGDFYHYSHGLKKHSGNCQRIAHGHRSKIVIFRNGQRDPQLEQQWSQKFCDVYLASRSDLVESAGEDLKFSYTAPQGDFELRLPADCCYLMEDDTTIERIAEHIADRLAEDNPQDNIAVQAYEGTGKGAIAHRRGDLGPQ